MWMTVLYHFKFQKQHFFPEHTGQSTSTDQCLQFCFDVPSSEGIFCAMLCSVTQQHTNLEQVED